MLAAAYVDHQSLDPPVQTKATTTPATVTRIPYRTPTKVNDTPSQERVTVARTTDPRSLMWPAAGAAVMMRPVDPQFGHRTTAPRA